MIDTALLLYSRHLSPRLTFEEKNLMLFYGAKWINWTQPSPSPRKSLIDQSHQHIGNIQWISFIHQWNQKGSSLLWKLLLSLTIPLQRVYFVWIQLLGKFFKITSKNEPTTMIWVGNRKSRAFSYVLTQIWSLTLLSWRNTVLTLKSIPTVDTKAEVKESSAYRNRKLVLPTELLPITRSLNM